MRGSHPLAALHPWAPREDDADAPGGPAAELPLEGLPELPPDPPRAERDRWRRSLSGWVERRATTVFAALYRKQADDLQERARRAVSSAYQERADDMEQRAVRAMRRALSEEAQRFKEVIEHAVAVKKREVRLSLLVLLTAALVYFLLDWFAKGNAP